MRTMRDPDREFYDRLYSQGGRVALRDRVVKAFRKPFYDALAGSLGCYRECVLDSAPQCDCLEVGIGTDKLFIELGQKGARVVAVDISCEAVRQAEREITGRALADRVSVICRDAEATGMPDNSFDVIYGKWILHHLRLDKAVGEITRLLRHTGRAIFVEPMGMNPFINLFRKITPNLRVRDEHPLTVHELGLIQGHFRRSRFEFYHLLLPLIPFLPDDVVRRWERGLIKKVPFLGPYSWQVVMVLSQPIK